MRQRVLRPHQTVAECAFAGDLEPDSCHVGCSAGEELIAVGTLIRQTPPFDAPAKGAYWQIRGMAVDAAWRGQGAGEKVLQALLAYAAWQGTPGIVWCNGRHGVKGFYKRYGFEQVGEVFELPGIGPHVVLRREFS